jgi:ribosomal protein S18 acetylase RimI-like enzyme
MISNNLFKITMRMVNAGSVTCADAFYNDPYTVHLVPDQRIRPNLRYGFEYYLRMSIIGGAELYTTSINCESVAVWQDSQIKEPFGLVLRGGNPFLPFRCGLRYVFGELRANNLCEKIRIKYAPTHYMYLALLAVHPLYQGKSYASKLLKPVLSKADDMRLPCFLETQNLKNVSMYQHFGFKVVHETLFDKIVPFYAMLRE